ncbi:MAG: ABC transporter ATP-binding protein [Spirochaetes bacterium]|nr:MAG: ABC transporter ATP-binding protein [Spirochaetota bacterium]
MKEDFLELRELVKIFGGDKNEVVAVDRVNLKVHEGEMVTLLGPSGCGKTTTLRMIAGFEHPTSGEIILEGERIKNVPPNKRPTTMVFQNYALFPHMTVYENISYGLKIHGRPEKEIKRRTEEVMRLVGLTGMERRSPTQLSGGQQQRVSLARSLVMEPKVLLLDEPLSNLDAKLRVATRMEIRKLQQRLGITSVYVTHDQEEAMTLSDRVVIMHEGRIQQVGTPREVYGKPANRFVADFIGKANFIKGKILRQTSDGETQVEVLGKTYNIKVERGAWSAGDEVVMVIRPESIVVGPGSLEAPTGKIRQSVYLGSQMVYEVEVGEYILSVEIANPGHERVFAEGEEVSLSFLERSLHVLPPEDK